MPKGKKGRKKDKDAQQKASKAKSISSQVDAFSSDILDGCLCNTNIIKEVFVRYYKVLFNDLVETIRPTTLADGTRPKAKAGGALSFDDLDAASLDPGVFSKVKLDSPKDCYDVFRFALDSFPGLLLENETKNVVIICETFHTIIYRTLLLEPDFFDKNFDLVELLVSRITPESPHGLWVLDLLFGFMRMMSQVPDFSSERQKSILNQTYIQLTSGAASSFFKLNVIINGLTFLQQGRGTCVDLFDIYGKDEYGLNLFDRIFRFGALNFEFLKDAPFAEDNFVSGQHLLHTVLYSKKSKMSLEYSNDLYDSLLKALESGILNGITYQNYLFNCLFESLEIAKALYITRLGGSTAGAKAEPPDLMNSEDGVEALQQIAQTDNLKKFGFWLGKSEDYVYKSLLSVVIFDRLLGRVESLGEAYDLGLFSESVMQFNTVAGFWVSSIFLQQKKFGCEDLYQKFINIIEQESSQRFFSETLKAFWVSLKSDVAELNPGGTESLAPNTSITDTTSIIQQHYKTKKSQSADSGRFVLRLASSHSVEPNCGGFGRVLSVLGSLIAKSPPLNYKIIYHIMSYLDKESETELQAELGCIGSDGPSARQSPLMALALYRLDISHMMLHKVASIMGQYGKLLSDPSLIGIEKTYAKAHQLVNNFYFLTLKSFKDNVDIFDMKLADPNNGEGWKVLLGLASMCIPGCVGTGWMLLSMLCFINQSSHRLPEQQYCDLIFTIYERMIAEPVPPEIFNEVLNFLRHLNQVYFQRDDPYFDPVEHKAGDKTLLQYFFEFLMVNHENLKSHKDAGILNQVDANTLLNLFLPVDLGLEVYAPYLSDAFTSALNRALSRASIGMQAIDILEVVNFLVDYHKDLKGMFISVQADFIRNKKGDAFAVSDRVKQKLYILNRNKNIKLVQSRFNYIYWGLLHLLVSALSSYKSSDSAYVGINKVLEKLLLWVAPKGDQFLDIIVDLAIEVGLDRARLDRSGVSSIVKPALMADKMLVEQLKELLELSICADPGSLDDMIAKAIKRSRVIVRLALVKAGHNFDAETINLFSDFLVFSLLQAPAFREELLAQARANDYFQKLFDGVDCPIDFKAIIGDDKADSFFLEEDAGDSESKEPDVLVGRARAVTKPSVSSDLGPTRAPLIFEYSKGCILDDFVNRLNQDQSFKKLKQLSLYYRIFIKGKVAVFPNLPINDLDLLLVPKSLSAAKKHYPGLSLSEIERLHQVTQVCIDDSSRVQKILGNAPTDNSALDPKRYEVFLSLPGETNYVRYHGFINQWMMLLGKSVDIEVSYHNDSKDTLQKLLLLNYLSVCSGLRELNIDISTNECSVGDVIYPKKTQEHLAAGPKKVAKFPFLYIGHNENPSQEGNRHSLGQLLEKNIELFEQEEFNSFIDWSKSKPLYDLLGKECEFLDKKPKGEI